MKEHQHLEDSPWKSSLPRGLSHSLGIPFFSPPSSRTFRGNSFQVVRLHTTLDHLLFVFVCILSLNRKATLAYSSLLDLCWTMASKGFAKEDRTACVVAGWCCGAEWPSRSLTTLRHFDPLSAVHTNSSLPVSPFIWSFTSPHLSFPLSSSARNPKWSNKSHQTVLCRTSGSC